MTEASKRLKLGELAGSIGKKLLSPTHAFRAIRLHRNRRNHRREQNDAQLNLYAQVIGEYLHLGYFDAPDIAADEISLADIRRAQQRYADRIIEYVKATPVLDIGCGMGGLLTQLVKKKIPSIGVTPDAKQIDHLKRTLSCPLWHSRFENLPDSELDGRFGTVITAESAQYLDRNLFPEKIARSLTSHGRWILCDYLDKTNEHPTRASWEYLYSELPHMGLRIVSDEDITENVLPTVRFLQYLGERLALPVFDYLTLKLKAREPGVYYLLEDAVGRTRSVIDSNLQIVDPERFTTQKSYRLMVVERN